jgi:hypothetical protein
MKWLPIFLTLCGFNPGQTLQIMYAIESIWTMGVISLGRFHH